VFLSLHPLELIKYFELSQDKIVLKERAKSYNSLSWIYLLEKNYKNAEIYAQKGVDIETDLFDINLAHAYLLQGKEKKALKIYLKYKNSIYIEEILKDFKKLRKKNISNDFFIEIEEVLMKGL